MAEKVIGKKCLWKKGIEEREYDFFFFTETPPSPPKTEEKKEPEQKKQPKQDSVSKEKKDVSENADQLLHTC